MKPRDSGKNKELGENRGKADERETRSFTVQSGRTPNFPFTTSASLHRILNRHWWSFLHRHAASYGVRWNHSLSPMGLTKQTWHADEP